MNLQRSLSHAIGSGFIVVDARHAEEGHIYDPKSGDTFAASMAMDGDTLRLRGYMGIKLFGKTEVWQRVAAPPGTCKPG